MNDDVVGSSSTDGIKTSAVTSSGIISARSQLRGGTGGEAECVRFNHNGQVLVGAGKSGVITLWHTNGTVLGELSRKQDAGKTLRALSFSSGARYLATGGSDAVV
jgi:WD40 repeat protein